MDETRIGLRRRERSRPRCVFDDTSAEALGINRAVVEYSLNTTLALLFDAIVLRELEL
jgi:hypothetical protein